MLFCLLSGLAKVMPGCRKALSIHAGQAAFAHKRVAAAQMISGVGGEFEQAHQVIDRALDDAG